MKGINEMGFFPRLIIFFVAVLVIYLFACVLIAFIDPLKAGSLAVTGIVQYATVITVIFCLWCLVCRGRI